MERPDIKDSIGDIGLSEANKIYTDSPKLFKHIQRLDSYIDYLEEKLESQNSSPSDEALPIGGVVGRSEQLVSFLREYQKACEIMHVNKIDAKNFVERYKTN